MNKELKSLTWKYFINQKLNEIGKLVAITLLVVFIPFFLGNSIGDGYDKMCAELTDGTMKCDIYLTWMEGVLYIIVTGFILIVTIALIWWWIDSNWEKAEKRAKEDLKLTQRKGGKKTR